jgi:mono/diheme cytochrome c family protein
MTEPARLPQTRKVLLFAAPFLLMALAYGTPLVLKTLRPPAEATAVAKAPPDGAKLYALNCAYCHGIDGDGNGAARLSLPARHFGRDDFKFGSTKPGSTKVRIPSDADLDGILRRGIPGSAMPSFAHLTEDERQAIVTHVRTLVPQGLLEREWDAAIRDAVKAAEQDGEEPPLAALHSVGRMDFEGRAEFASKISAAKREEFWRRALENSAVGPELEIPEPTPKRPDSIARGKQYFKELNCISCHGEQGRGDGETVKMNPEYFEAYRKNPSDKTNRKNFETNIVKPGLRYPDGSLLMPRNFTTGLFKGGRDPKQLYARIVLGIPPAMNATENQPPEKIYDIIYFILSLSPEPE